MSQDNNIGDPNGNFIVFGRKSWEGLIPEIAEKEKRGKKIQTRLDPAYVLELVSKGKITQQLAAQLPNESVQNYILKTFPHGSLNIPSFN